MNTLYHAGPKGLTELRTLRMLIEGGVVSVEDAQESWQKKWGDWIEEDTLMSHPTMDEISCTCDLEMAQEIATKIGGCVYRVDADVLRINEEDCPTVAGPVACELA